MYNTEEREKRNPLLRVAGLVMSFVMLFTFCIPMQAFAQSDDVLELTGEQAADIPADSTAPEGADNADADEVVSDTEPQLQVYTAVSSDGLASVEVSGTSLPEGGYASIERISDDGAKSEITGSLSDGDIEYEDFVAFDISIYNELGEEIEPDDTVSVEISVDESLIPSDIPENEFSLTHLKEGSGETAAERVSNDISLEASALKASFETDSFSKFVLSWNGYGSTKYFELTVYYVDENGKEIGTSTQNSNLGNGVSISFDSYGKEIDGYTYKEARTGSASGNIVTSVYTYQTGTPSNRKRYMELYNGSTRVSQNQYYSSTVKKNVYLIYETNEVNPLTLEDTVAQNGSFTANLLSGYNASSYKWSSSSSKNGTYTVINGETSKTLSITENGSRKYYKVTVTLQSGKQFTSEAVFSPYYTSIQNGSFESPGINNFYSQPSNIEYNAANGVWQSTAGAIEILRPSSNRNSAYDFYNIGIRETLPTPDGVQAAEINCESAGALYQDVITNPGENIFWSLYHRARGTWHGGIVPGDQDTMYVIIMSSEAASEMTQSDVGDLLSSAGYDMNTSTGNSSKTVVYNGKSVTIWQITDPQSWVLHNGSYTVPQDQYLTRFFFASGYTSSGNNTVGNFIDNVSFSSEKAYRIEYYADGELIESEGGMFNATTQNGNTVSATKLASVKSQYSSYTLSNVLLNGSVTALTTTGMTLNRYKDNVLQYYFTKKPIEKTALTLTKVWNDNNNAFGSRPEDVTLVLTNSKSGEKINVTLDSSNAESANKWKITVNVPKYNSDKTLASYTLSEETVFGYSAAVSGYTVTNTQVSGAMTVSKKWENNAGAALSASGIPFSAIELDVIQYYNITVGDKTERQIVNSATITLSAENSWSAAYPGGALDFTSFDVTAERYFDKDGKLAAAGDFTMGDFNFKRDYSNVTADLSGRLQTCANHNITVPGNGVVLIGLTDSKQYLIWSPYINDMGEAEIAAMKQAVVNARASGAANAKVENISVYTGGNPAVAITDLENGAASVAFSASCDWRQVWYGGMVFTNTAATGELTNVLNTDKTQDITLTKIWDDAADNSLRPSSVTFELSGLTKYEKVLSGEGDSWSDTVTVPVYNANGEKITYTLSEQTVPYYTVNSIEGYTITNERSSAKLVITKTISGDLSAEAAAALKNSIILTVSAADGSGSYTVYGDNTVLGEHKLTWNGLVGTCEIEVVPGKTYSVTESGEDVFGYTLIKTVSSPVASIAGQTVNLSVTNDYTRFKGSIKILKTITGATTDEDRNGVFQFEIKNTQTGVCYYATVYGESFDIVSNLPAGKYEVRELSSNSYDYVSGNTTVYIGCAEIDGKLVNNGNIKSVSCPFVNHCDTNGFKAEDAAVNLKTNDGNGFATFIKRRESEEEE